MILQKKKKTKSVKKTSGVKIKNKMYLTKQMLKIKMSFLDCKETQYNLNVYVYIRNQKKFKYVSRKKEFNIKIYFPHVNFKQIENGVVKDNQTRHLFSNCLLTTQNIYNLKCDILFYYNVNAKPPFLDDLIKKILLNNTYNLVLKNKHYKKNQLEGLKTDFEQLIKNLGGNLIINGNEKINPSKSKLTFLVNDKVTFGIKLNTKIYTINKYDHEFNSINLYELYLHITKKLKINLSNHKRTHPNDKNWLLKDWLLSDLYLIIIINKQSIETTVPFNLMNFEYAKAANILNFINQKKVNDVYYKHVESGFKGTEIYFIVDKFKEIPMFLYVPKSEYENNDTLTNKNLHLKFISVKNERVGFNIVYPYCLYKAIKEHVWKKCKLVVNYPSQQTLQILQSISKKQSKKIHTDPVFFIENIYFNTFYVHNLMYKFNDFLIKRNEILYTQNEGEVEKYLPFIKDQRIQILLELERKKIEIDLSMSTLIKKAVKLNNNRTKWPIKNLRIVLKYGAIKKKSLKFDLYPIKSLYQKVHELTVIPFDWNSRHKYYKKNVPLSYFEKRMLLNIIDITLFNYIYDEPLIKSEIDRLPDSKLEKVGSHVFVKNHLNITDKQKNILHDWLNNYDDYSKVPFINKEISKKFDFVSSEPQKEKEIIPRI